MTVKKKNQKGEGKKPRQSLGHIVNNNLFMLRLLFKAAPAYVIVSLFCNLMSGAYSFFAGTYIYKYALNSLAEGKELKSIIMIVAAMVVCCVLVQIIYIITGRVLDVLNFKIHRYIKGMIHEKASKVDIACFENTVFFDTYIKASDDALKRAYAVLDSCGGILYFIVSIGGTLALVATISPIFILITAVPLIMKLTVGKRQNKLKHEASMKYKEVDRQKGYVRRTFYLKDYSKEMRLTEMYKVMMKRMSTSVSELKEITRKYGYKKMFFRYLFDIMEIVIIYGTTVVIASYQALVKRTMLPGDFFVVLNSVTTVSYGLEYAAQLLLDFEENSLYIDNFREFLDYEIKIKEDENAPDAPEPETLTLENLTFGYSGQKGSALNNVSLTLNKGEKIAIVGHNGAGKSTLIKLLQRLYDPEDGNGAILLNGINIKDLKLSSYRGLFGTVFQDYGLFAVSVAENVMLRGDLTEEDREKVKDALIKSGIYEKIQKLPHGIDTVVTKEFDSDGAVFSGGEEQKIAIARIFAGDAKIVIMDEPTSALDPIAEEQMYRNMFEACRDKTVIYISHRLSSCTMADRVYMFANGSVIESGTHAELLAAGGRYADMWHKQADAYKLHSEYAATDRSDGNEVAV